MTDTKYMKHRLFPVMIAVALFIPALLTAQVIQPQSGTSARTAFIEEARKYLGVPYRSGGSTLRGMDCSGLVFRAAIDGPGVSIPRTVHSLSDRAKHVPDASREPGDLLFFNTTGRISHVGIYLGNNRFIHAASDGPNTGVIISKLSEPYWKRTYRFAGSVLDSEPDTSWPKPDESDTDASSPAQPVHPFTGTFGARLNATGGILWDFMPGEYPIRGGTVFAEVSWVKNTTIYPGLGAGLSWDRRTESISIPLTASISVPSGFRFFIGTQYHLRTKNDLNRDLQFPGIIGMSWTSKSAVLLGQNLRFYQSAEYSWFPGETFGLGFRFNTGLTLSFDF